MVDDWLETAKRRANEQLGSAPKDAIHRALPIAIIGCFGGVIAVSIVGGDADFGGAWAGILVGAIAYLYFANETRAFYKKYGEIIERYRPKE